MENLIHDLQYAARMLFKRPTFSAIVVITLALGIGANTAIFTVVDAALLRGLPYKNPERLAACYFPTRRAANVDPLVALRYE